MVSSYCHNSSRSSTVSSKLNEPDFEKILSAHPPLAFEPEFVLGSTSKNLISVPISVSATDLVLASGSSFPIVELGAQLVEILGRDVYLKAELQRFLKICIGAKVSFNNKFYLILKIGFPYLYFEMSHLNYY